MKIPRRRFVWIKTITQAEHDGAPVKPTGTVYVKSLTKIVNLDRAEGYDMESLGFTLARM